jgi:quercetin dioxygenase-like cupin family protein
MNEGNKVIVTSADAIPKKSVQAGSGTFMQILIGSGDAPNFIMRRFIMEPDGGMPNHTNSIEHEQFILKGRARVGIGEDVYEVKRGDVVFIPRGIPHWYKAEGDEPFEFLCVVPNIPDHIEILKKGETKG